MTPRPTEMHSLQADRFNSQNIPLSCVKQSRTQIFTSMTAQLLASAAMLITTLSVHSASGTTLKRHGSNRGHVLYTTARACRGDVVGSNNRAADSDRSSNDRYLRSLFDLVAE